MILTRNGKKKGLRGHALAEISTSKEFFSRVKKCDQLIGLCWTAVF
jgi:hypothetical protein